jgi:MFS family permease
VTTRDPRRSEGLRASIDLLRRNADFRRLYLATLVSFAGDWFLVVALFGLVEDLTGSAALVGLTIAVQELAFFAFSPLGGALADRLDRRRLMIAADLIRAGLALGFLLVDERGEVWLVFVLLAAISSFTASFEPAATAAIPNLVDDEDLGPANALVGSAWGMMLAVGAALGGLVAVALGRDAAIVGDAISFGLSAVLLWRVRRAFSAPREPVEHHPTVREATRETVRYARRDHRVLSLLAVKGGFGLAAGVLVLIAVFALDVFEAGDLGTGLLMAARGAGALVGPFLGRAFAGRDDRRLYPAIGLALATFGGGYLVFGASPSLAVACGVVFVAHLGGGAQWTLSTYGLQRIVPDRIRGRIFAFDYALVTLTLGLSSFLAGNAAETFGPRPTAFVLGALALGWALVWWLATSRVRREPLVAPLGREVRGRGR